MDAAKRQLDILGSQLEGARASLEQARASLADVSLRLSYSRIVAPISGTIGQKGVRTGAYVTVGTTLLSIVPLDKLYVPANFRETQLARIRAGQTVEITVDALPGRHFKGAVDSLGPASGVSYSAVAPQNATGNFTKVAQRLPVRIRISWRTILAKRENFRAAFAGFDFRKVALFNEADVTRLLADAGVIRHRGKIEAVINNAGRACELIETEGSLAAFVWRFEADDDGARPQSRSTSPASEALSKELRKRGWKFVGPTTVYALCRRWGWSMTMQRIASCEIEKARSASRRFP